MIGTHRVLSKDVQFKDLGLLIIDEERVSVSRTKKRSKAAGKHRCADPDGNADPTDAAYEPGWDPRYERSGGSTDGACADPDICHGIQRRDGARSDQPGTGTGRTGHYVYNRVNTIVETANKIASLVPEARVAFAHGQMKERELEKIMYDFINGEIDVLVSTTIIETGLDISNVNTMIIHDADNLGLSQLLSASRARGTFKPDGIRIF